MVRSGDSAQRGGVGDSKSESVPMDLWSRLKRAGSAEEFASVWLEILLVPGESVEDRAREIMTIAEVDPLNVEVVLAASQFGSVQVGMEAEITPLIQGGKIQFADVAVVDRTIDAASDTFGVQLQIENANHEIPGGIRCTIDFVLESGSAGP